MCRLTAVQTDAMTGSLLMGAVLILWLILTAVVIRAALRKLREGNVFFFLLLVALIAGVTYAFGGYLLWAAEGLRCLVEARTVGTCGQ